MTELEASMVPSLDLLPGEEALAQSYLHSVVPTSMTAPRWLTAVAKHVPRMQRWWRCI
jgi:hypothetical protein